MTNYPPSNDHLAERLKELQAEKLDWLQRTTVIPAPPRRKVVEFMIPFTEERLSLTTDPEKKRFLEKSLRELKSELETLNN